VPKTNNQFWAAKFADNKLRDKRTDAMLEALGWQVLVVWECELDRTLEDVIQRLISCAES
jgi:DNA mismatch endonuclease (patch repair protein)